MIRFKDFLLEGAAMFAKMTRAEWEKPKAKTNDLRTDILKDAIANNNPIPDIDGKNIIVLNTKQNLKSIDNFTKSRDNVFFLDVKGGKTIQSNVIGKSPLFGGAGKGAGATGATANGEALQCLYLAALQGEGIKHQFSHFTPELLKKYAGKIDTDRTFDEMMSSAAEWHVSAYITGKALINKKYVGRDHVFHRGSTVMNNIYKMKGKAFKADKKPPLNNDKWNPGDIWAIKKNVDLNKVLDASSVMNLNATLKQAFLDRTIIGISLKQINNLKKKAKATDYNLDGVELGKHTYSHSLLKASTRTATYWSFKGGYIYFDRQKKMDVRAPTTLGAINVEIQGSGARGGRAGYGAIVYAAKEYLGVTLKDNNSLKAAARKMVGGKDEKAAKDLWKKANSIHSDIQWDAFWEELKKSTVDRIHANLAATEIIYAVDNAAKSKRDEFVSYMVNIAGSKTSDSSVYVKLEAGG